LAVSKLNIFKTMNISTVLPSGRRSLLERWLSIREILGLIPEPTTILTEVSPGHFSDTPDK